MRNSLLAFKNFDLEKGDSLLNVAFFESDSFLKNDILLVKEIMARYRGKVEVKILAEYYLGYYFADSHKSALLESSKEAKNDLINYLKLLDCLSVEGKSFRLCKNFLDAMSDTLLIFHGSFLMFKKFHKTQITECLELLSDLIKKYPQTPYSEIASGYLRTIKFH
ncbi:MAG: hypothetical protein QMD82_06715 [bacterium]|nr:hypothetical protein [bacterium]